MPLLIGRVAGLAAVCASVLMAGCGLERLNECGLEGCPVTSVVTGFAPGTLPSSSPTAFTVMGDNLAYAAQAGSIVPKRIRFTASSGTPFMGGTSATLEVDVTSHSATEAHGISPVAGVTGSVACRVSVDLVKQTYDTPDTPVETVTSSAELVVFVGP